MDAMTVFPSKWWRSVDLDDGGEQPLTIRSVRMDKVGMGDEQVEKPVIYFYEDQRGLIANKTNWTMLTERFGRNTDDWLDKQIVLYVTETSLRGKPTKCLRIRLPKRRPAPLGPVAQVNPDLDDEIPF